MRKYIQYDLPEIKQGSKLIEAVDIETREKQTILSACSNFEYAKFISTIKKLFRPSRAAIDDSTVQSETFYSNRKKQLVPQTKQKYPNTKPAKFLNVLSVTEIITELATTYRSNHILETGNFGLKRIRR